MELLISYSTFTRRSIYRVHYTTLPSPTLFSFFHSGRYRPIFSNQVGRSYLFIPYSLYIYRLFTKTNPPPPKNLLTCFCTGVLCTDYTIANPPPPPGAPRRLLPPENEATFLSLIMSSAYTLVYIPTVHVIRYGVTEYY